MSEPRKLVMTISLNALEHLGINLYSNIPAVLSEVVANAWDADAKKVSVIIDKTAETIVIEDDGTGMDRDGVIDRFLTVGYKRRDCDFSANNDSESPPEQRLWQHCLTRISQKIDSLGSKPNFRLHVPLPPLPI